MSEQKANVEKLYVHMVESPSPDDLLRSRTEGRTLCAFLDLAGISCSYSLVSNAATFRTALFDRVLEAMRSTQRLPIIHFSGHGCTKGIALTDGTLLTWQGFADTIRPINEAMKGELLVCLSSCYGTSVWPTVLSTTVALPAHTFVAARGEVGYHEAAIGFVAFYHHLLRLNREVADALAAMRAASGHDGFGIISSTQIQDLARRYKALGPAEQHRVLEALRKRGAARE